VFGSFYIFLEVKSDDILGNLNVYNISYFWY
jgi:hypothetical protein